jgi:aspartate kinase
LIPVTVAKFGGSALGVDGILIGKIINRIEQLREKTKDVAVFSAPLITYQEKP